MDGGEEQNLRILMIISVAFEIFCERGNDEDERTNDGCLLVFVALWFLLEGVIATQGWLTNSRAKTDRP